MNKEIEMPEPPDGYEWIRVGCNNNYSYSEIKVTYKPLKTATHRPDDTPLEIDPLPEMPDNVERVEYFGKGLKPEDMGDADNYIFYDSEWYDIDEIKCGVKFKRPVGCADHYARVWYKKPEPAKTKLSDLIGEDGQKNAYLHWDDGSWDVFRPASDGISNIEFYDVTHKIRGQYEGFKHDEDIIKWSNSPFTAYEDANEFNF